MNFWGIFALQNAPRPMNAFEIVNMKRNRPIMFSLATPTRDELKRMYEWVRPEIAIPVQW